MEGIGTAITTVTGWLTNAISMFTSEPLVYFLALGLIGGVIGVFGKAKRTAR